MLVGYWTVEEDRLDGEDASDGIGACLPSSTSHSFTTTCRIGTGEEMPAGACGSYRAGFNEDKVELHVSRFSIFWDFLVWEWRKQFSAGKSCKFIIQFKFPFSCISKSKGDNEGLCTIHRFPFRGKKSIRVSMLVCRFHHFSKFTEVLCMLMS